MIAVDAPAPSRWTSHTAHYPSANATHPEPPMPKHLTLAELTAGLPEILTSPADNGALRAIVIRPSSGQRRDLDTCEISLALGTQGDHWAESRWKPTEAGRPRPDVRACIHPDGDQSDLRLFSPRQIRLSIS